MHMREDNIIDYASSESGSYDKVVWGKERVNTKLLMIFNLINVFMYILCMYRMLASLIAIFLLLIHWVNNAVQKYIVPLYQFVMATTSQKLVSQFVLYFLLCYVSICFRTNNT